MDSNESDASLVMHGKSGELINFGLEGRGGKGRGGGGGRVVGPR